ncbi:MAG: hypothetical protein U0S48_16495 [Solirubrobacteraceae bacterium]
MRKGTGAGWRSSARGWSTLRLGYVREHGYDPRRSRAAFDKDERIAALKYGIPTSARCTPTTS